MSTSNIDVICQFQGKKIFYLGSSNFEFLSWENNYGFT